VRDLSAGLHSQRLQRVKPSTSASASGSGIVSFSFLPPTP